MTSATFETATLNPKRKFPSVGNVPFGVPAHV